MFQVDYRKIDFPNTYYIDLGPMMISSHKIKLTSFFFSSKYDKYSKNKLKIIQTVLFGR